MTPETIYLVPAEDDSGPTIAWSDDPGDDWQGAVEYVRLDVAAKTTTQAREERDALAEALDEAMHLHHESCAQDGEWPHDLRFAADVWQSSERSTTSLTRRDALMKAEALEREVITLAQGPGREYPEWSDYMAGWDAACEVINNAAQELLRQAEGADDD